MSLATALLVAIAVTAALARMMQGRPTRRPGPEPTVHDTTVRSSSSWALPRLRRPSCAVRPSALASWADDLSRSLRHGSTLHAALTHTIPTDPSIERHSAPLRHWLGRGATVAEACDEWADELGEQVGSALRPSDRIELLATMAAVLAATASLGGAAAAPLDRFAVTMRQRASDDLERAAHSAQAQMSAKVLTSVPIAVLVLLLITDADVRGIVGSATGGSVVLLGLGLNTLGGLWMRRIAGAGAGA